MIICFISDNALKKPYNFVENKENKRQLMTFIGPN